MRRLAADRLCLYFPVSTQLRQQCKPSLGHISACLQTCCFEVMLQCLRSPESENEILLPPEPRLATLTVNPKAGVAVTPCCRSSITTSLTY